MRNNACAKPKTFLDDYREEIEPWLREIDLYVKTEDPPYSIPEISALLRIGEQEVSSITRERRMDSIGKQQFFTIMENGSSRICRMYQRELRRGSPYVYTADDISYIYDLRNETVLSACRDLGMREATVLMLPALFSRIPV